MSQQSGYLHGDEPLAEAWTVDVKWRAVWLRAIAKAWQDEAYKQRLLTRPEEALREVGYLMPEFHAEQLQIVVEEVPAAARPRAEYVQTDSGASKHANGWATAGNSLRSTLTLRLPPAPPLEDRALAIADYDAAGRVYPFTFC